LGYMTDMFCSTVLGYEIEVMYNKDIDQNYVEKISNILIILIQYFWKKYVLL